MGEGSREYGYEVCGGAPLSPLSMGPERPRYDTAFRIIHPAAGSIAVNHTDAIYPTVG